MISSDFRAEARRKLSGKWGKVACISLAYVFVFFILGFIEGLLPDSMGGIFSLVSTIIEIPLTFGTIISFMKLYNNEEVKAFDFLSLGFSNFAKSWKVSLNVLVKMLIPIILIIVSYVLIGLGAVSMLTTYSSSNSFSGLTVVGFILLIVSMVWAITKSYYYQLAYFIAIDNSDLTAKESVEKSAELMTGNRKKLFCLQLSFIGWSILASITLGIGFLWLMPYLQFALIAFYKFVSGDNSGVEAKVVTENSNDTIQGE